MSNCHESRPGDDPSHHQRSPPPIFLDSIAITLHTCHPSHSQLFPITMDYLYTTLLLLCLVELYVYMYICFSVCCNSLIILFPALYDTSTVLPSVVSHSVFCSVFCLLAFLLFNKAFHQHLDPDPCLSAVPLARTVTLISCKTIIIGVYITLNNASSMQNMYHLKHHLLFKCI